MSETTFVKSKKAYVKTEKLTVHKTKEPPRRTTVENPLTTEQKGIIKTLINDWITTSNLAKKSLVYGSAFKRLYEDGLQGAVNGIEQIEQSEFDQCCFYIKQRIMMLENSDKSGVTRQKDDWRKKRVIAIQTKRRKAGVSDDKFRSYIEARWNVESIISLDDDELEQCYRYAMQPKGATWEPPKEVIPNIQVMRERALEIWLSNQEQETPFFNRQDIFIPGGKKSAELALYEQDRTLFGDSRGRMLGEDALKGFWRLQTLCRFRPGRPPKANDPD